MIKKCPRTPNCVSSVEKDRKKFVEPIRFSGSTRDAQYLILEILFSMKRTKVVEYDDRYIHAESRSAIFGFVDDLEFSFDGHQKVINLKSASRVGVSDLGVNRKRIETIRRRFIDKNNQVFSMDHKQ